MTGGAMFLTFLGSMTGPLAFATLVDATGSHGLSYALLATVPAMVGAWLWMASREA